jgi:hypothetical protein
VAVVEFRSRFFAAAALVVTAACGRSADSGKQDTPAKVAPASAAPTAPEATVDATPGATVHAAIDAATDAPPGAELVITAAPLKPGTSSIVTFDAKIDLDLNFGGMGQVTSSTRTKKKKVEIVGVDPDGTVHKRITYLVRQTNAIVDGERKKDVNPNRGKTYLVTWKDKVVDVKRANGKPVSEEELAAIHSDEGQLQAPEMLGKMLSGIRLVEGQPFELPAFALEKFSLPTGYRVRRMVLTYRGTTREGVRIDAEGAIASDGPGAKTFLDLTSEILLDATGWVLSSRVTGQVRAELGGAVVGSGAGTATLTATLPR